METVVIFFESTDTFFNYVFTLSKTELLWCKNLILIFVQKNRVLTPH